MTFDLDAAKKVVSAWERTAAQLADAAVRDPRTLDLGARLLKSQLLWKKAFDTAVDAFWAPFLPVRDPAAAPAATKETI